MPGQVLAPLVALAGALVFSGLVAFTSGWNRRSGGVDRYRYYDDGTIVSDSIRLANESVAGARIVGIAAASLASLGFERLAPNDRAPNSDVLEFDRVDRERVVVKHDEIGEFSAFDAADFSVQL